MSREAIWARIRMAWAMLARRRDRDVRSGRPRETPPPRRGDEPPLSRTGFTDEALPWLDAVYRFALRLTQGDRDAAEDLVQETFLKAYRSWHTFERGTRAKSWLFTICRNTWLHEKDRLRSRMERTIGDLDAKVDDLAGTPYGETTAPGHDPDVFEHLLDDDVVRAIDELPSDFREVLVLSDLGDLKYAEIAEVLAIPVGTVRSRLSRARRILQDRLRDFAVEAGYVEGPRE